MIRFSVPVWDGGVQVEAATAEVAGLDVDVVALGVLGDLGTQAREAPVVEVQVAAAQVASADALDAGVAGAVHQRGDEEHGTAETGRDVGGQDGALGVVELGGVDDDGSLGLMELDLGAHVFGELESSVDVLDNRNVPQHRTAPGRE
jgi:hypothetical protein